MEQITGPEVQAQPLCQGDNPENALYQAWKEASEIARPQIEAALRPLLYRHASKVCWMVLHFNQPHLIQEIVDDTFLDLGKFEERSLFSTWFHARATYRCRKELRSAIRRREVSVGGFSNAYGDLGKSQRPDQELRGIVGDMLSKLTQREQELIRLKIDEGLPDREVAVRLGLHPVYIQRLWKALRKRLRSMYGRKAR